MPIDISHFSMVGFAIDVTDGAALSRSASMFLPLCRDIPMPDGLVICSIQDKSGGELRIAMRNHPGGSPEIITMNPAFAGEGRAAIDVAADVSDPEYKSAEIRIAAHFSGEETPIVFDLADPSQAPAFQPGAKLTVDIAAFGYNARIYPDEAAYYAARTGVPFAANYFVPSGMFFESKGGAMPDDAPRPTPYADFAGTVLQAHLNTNALGTGQFWSATVKTYAGATFDIVLDPREVPAPITPGEILTGRFWLSARMAK